MKNQKLVFGALMGIDEIHGALLVDIKLLIQDKYKWRYSHRYAAIVTREDLLSLKLVNEDELIRDAFNLYDIDLREQYESKE